MAVDLFPFWLEAARQGVKRSMIYDQNAGEKPEAEVDEHRHVFEDDDNRIFSHVFPHHQKEVPENTEKNKNCREDQVFGPEDVDGPFGDSVKRVRDRHSGRCDHHGAVEECDIVLFQYSSL